MSHFMLRSTGTVYMVWKAMKHGDESMSQFMFRTGTVSMEWRATKHGI